MLKLLKVTLREPDVFQKHRIMNKVLIKALFNLKSTKLMQKVIFAL